MANLKKSITDLVSQSQDTRSSFNIGLSALKNQNYDTAIKKFQQVLEIDGSDDMARSVYPNLGQAYLLNDQPDQAIVQFRNALRLNPDAATRAFIHANMGYIYTQQQFHGFAIREYRHAVKENNKDVTSYLTLGMLYESVFQPADAREAFERVLKLAPNHAYAQESLTRLEATSPIVSRDEVVRLVKRLGTLGLIVVMTYDATYDGYFPMIIYIYPSSPVREKVHPGDKIINVFISGSEPVEEDDERDLIELLESPPNTDISFLVGEAEIKTRCVQPDNKTMEQNERIQVYRNWLNTFDGRLAWLWSATPDIRTHIGPIWGSELDSLVRELLPLKHTPVYDFAYALLVEHIQAFSITEDGQEIELQYVVNLGKNHFDKVPPDLIQTFSEMQFQYVANLLASRT